MRRRRLLTTAAAALMMRPLPASAATGDAADDFRAASRTLETAVASGQVAAASIHVVRDGRTFAAAFGHDCDTASMFLLGSISKPITVAALLTLLDEGRVALEDPASKFLPAFTGDGRERITVAQLLTHVSGLPDQLPDNDRLRAAHAPLAAFVEGATRTPLLFRPGERYGYSSMAILLAARIAEIVGGAEIRDLVARRVFEPLGMRQAAQGLGRFPLERMVRCQTDRAAPESGGGDPRARDWDWNSPYWRSLGAPWGGTHASAADVARFLAACMDPPPGWLTRDTARRMITDRNPPGLCRRGLGFALGPPLGGSDAGGGTFGHTGSTGTIAWADPATGTICVVLTSLPTIAADPHPRDEASRQIRSR
jgi:CubicO group peptidase (beta-lactamase class C family)